VKSLADSQLIFGVKYTMRLSLIHLYCISIMIACAPALNAQVYTLQKKSDIIYGSSILALSAIDIALSQSTPVLSEEDILQLNPQKVLRIDRFAIGNNSTKADHWSDYLHYSAMTFPLIMTTTGLNKKEYGILGIMLLETVSLNASLTFASKYIITKPRPFVYDPAVSISDKQSNSARLSFVSGHTSSTASLGFFTAKVFSDINPTSNWKPVVWTVGLVLPAVVGALRVSAGRHFVTDVIAGYALGGLIGWGIPMLHKNDKNIELMLGQNGGIVLRFQLN